MKYKVSIVQDIEFTETKLITGTLSPEFNHSRIISIPKIGQEHLDFFDIGCITFCVYGKQEDTEGDPKLVKLTTKVRTTQGGSLSRCQDNIIEIFSDSSACAERFKIFDIFFSFGAIVMK